jgi:hypothetical protein
MIIKKRYTPKEENVKKLQKYLLKLSKEEKK